jgi:dTDP-L-rhamnose 4-epimerase
MKILLIGGGGFIGSRTALRLLAAGHEPVVLDCFDPQVHGPEPKASATCRELFGAVDVRVGDTRDAAAVQAALEGVEAAYYFPAGTGTGQSMYQVEKYCDVNARGAGVFAEAMVAARDHLRRVIVSSTRAVYGEGAASCPEHGRVFPKPRLAAAMEAGNFETSCPRCDAPVRPEASREDDPFLPLSIYGITKLAQEQVIATAAAGAGLPCTVFRYQNVYGPGQSLKNPYTGILGIFTQLAAAGREINLFEDALPTRDFVHVDDVVEYNVRALFAESPDAVVLNVGSGVRSTLADLAAAVSAGLGRETPVRVSGQFRIGDIRHAAADLSELTTHLGGHAFVSLKDGVKTFTDWATAEGVEDAGNQNFLRSLEEMRAAGLLRSSS